MAIDYRNLTDDEVREIVKDHQGIAKEVLRASERTTDLIREARQGLANDLAFHMRKVSDIEEMYEKARNQLKSMSPSDAEYEKQLKTVNEYKRQVKGATISRDEFITRLQQAGNDNIVEQARNQAATQLIDEKIQEKMTQADNLQKTIESLKKQRDAGEDVTEELNRAKEQLENLHLEVNDISNNTSRKFKNVGRKEKGSSNITNQFGVNSFINTINDARKRAKEENAGSAIGKLINNLTGQGGVKEALGKIGGVVKQIFDVCVAMRTSVDKWVDEAAKVYANNVGRINAALEGTGKLFQDSTDMMVSSLGLNRFVDQKQYIQKIAELTASGLNYNVEQRALLETIKDKTIKSFSSMDGNLVRLIRLKQKDITQAQFGLEAALRNTLNKIFKDTQYLDQMYDTIAGAITDSVVMSGGKDVTQYSSVIQTWMGAMYASGIDSGTVSKLATALNNLGSGNVTALAGDQEIQRLMLLSMDTIGMDYADILQQGLSTSDINDLLGAVVNYLSKIESNTKDNNVLTASYTNLFGMSRADLQGFKNLRGKMGSLTAVDTGGALAVMNQELAKFQSTERTTALEQIENVISNAKFTFGRSIAEDPKDYLAWKVSNMILDFKEQFKDSDSKLGKVAKGILSLLSKPAELLIFQQELGGFVDIVQSLPSLWVSGEGEGTLNAILNAGPSSGGDVTSYGGDLINASASSNFKSVNLQSLRSTNAYATSQNSLINLSDINWEDTSDAEDEVLTELKEISKALVKAEADAKHYAFATYLVGMTDDTLRSFASIFADEDAMTETFEGKNEVLKDNLFKYLDDTTSNSKKTKAKTKAKTNTKTTTTGGGTVSTI